MSIDTERSGAYYVAAKFISNKEKLEHYTQSSSVNHPQHHQIHHCRSNSKQKYDKSKSTYTIYLTYSKN